MLKNTQSSGSWYSVLDVMVSHPKMLLLRVDQKREKVNIYSFQYTCLLIELHVCREHR